ncbi:MAG: 16S rRNA (guanine(527)-N(7))-methyltransferase RsmG [bacterium]
MASSVGYELEILKKGFKELQLDYTEIILDKFRVYLETLYAFKGRLHLLSHADYNRISLKHFLPSLAALKLIGDGKSACDIGAGAGFPSVPLKILKPAIEFTLFESNKKKAKFLEYLIERLALEKISTINCRAEEYEDDGYEFVFVRAAGKIKKLARTVDFLLKPGGRALFYKPPNIGTELDEAKKEIRKYRFVVSVERLLTPVAHEPLTLVLLQKQG